MSNQSIMIPKLEELKILPVVKLDRVSDALPLGEALIKGGLPAAEITFRTDAAEESIRLMRKEYPDMLVGAGTVTLLEHAKRALDAGAGFFVSAGVNPKVVEFAIDNNVPIFAGACTPTEITMLLEYGLEVCKFFPAKQYGGLDTIKALSGPFPQMRFMPTGGVSASNLKEYLSFKKIIAVGGSWMVKGDLINAGDWDEITRLTAEAVKLANE